MLVLVDHTDTVVKLVGVVHGRANADDVEVVLTSLKDCVSKSRDNIKKNWTHTASVLVG